MVKVIHSDDKRIPDGALLIMINDHAIDDPLEYQYYNDIAKTRKIVLKNKGTKYEVILKSDERIMLDIEEPVYRQCENSCDFCFINGLPKGLRKELYFRDDDYRLSFLFGNFLSLTNISEEDVKRIGRLKLSPLYVSVHATDPELRKRIFKNDKARYIREQLSHLVDNDVHIHCQIVVIPDLTDGVQLSKSIRDLSTLYPGVSSIGIVPVGRTRHLNGIPAVSKIGALETIAIVNEFHNQFRRKHRRGIVYCADEFYIKAGFPIPNTEYYDDFPQHENGIGMLRFFINEIEGLRRMKEVRGKLLILTGRLALPFITLLKVKLEGNGSRRNASVDLVGVDNLFFGESVTVSGLIGAGDFIRAINALKTDCDRIILPPNCTNDTGEFIDSQIINDDRTIVSPRSIEKLIECLQQ